MTSTITAAPALPPLLLEHLAHFTALGCPPPAAPPLAGAPGVDSP